MPCAASTSAGASAAQPAQPEHPEHLALCHEAMGTTFSIETAHPDARYARQAFMAAFAELDALESHLSRLVEGSDVWRINRLRKGEAAVVAPDTFLCLAAALQVQQWTGGAFDVTYASAPGSNPTARLRLVPDGCRVVAEAGGVQVDLGGIGKGYALDRMAAVLQDWDVTAVCLAASTSTVLAMDAPPGAPGWNVTFDPGDGRRRLALVRAAFSASGIGVKGQHVVDPRTRRPARQRVRAWARATTAAHADALSTAFLVMTPEEAARCCRHWPDDGLVQADLALSPNRDEESIRAET